MFLGTEVILAICQIVLFFLWAHPCPLEARCGCVICFGQWNRSVVCLFRVEILRAKMHFTTCYSGYASCFLEAQSWSLPLPVGGWDCRVQPTRLNKQREQEKNCVVLYPLLHVSVYLFFSYCSNCGFTGFPGGSDGKESACSVGDPGLIPESGRSPEEGNGFPLQNSCLENSMDRGALAGLRKESDMTEQLTLSFS